MTSFTPISAAIGGALIGLAAVILMATLGRIAGISGMLSRLLPPYEDSATSVRVSFLAGLIAAPASALAIGQAPTIEVTGSTITLLAAGLLVGFGSVFGSGCTSGHGICGMARLSPRSIAATLIFMVTAVTTSYVARHGFGL